MVNKYRKKPVIIDAVQFTDTNKQQVYHWVSAIQMNIHISVEGIDEKPCLIIPTLEGDMICSLGDYLIVEPFPTDWRKIYPCKEEIFNKTYDDVKEYIGVDLAAGPDYTGWPKQSK